MSPVICQFGLFVKKNVRQNKTVGVTTKLIQVLPTEETGNLITVKFNQVLPTKFFSISLFLLFSMFIFMIIQLKIIVNTCNFHYMLPVLDVLYNFQNILALFQLYMVFLNCLVFSFYLVLCESNSFELEIARNFDTRSTTNCTRL